MPSPTRAESPPTNGGTVAADPPRPRRAPVWPSTRQPRRPNRLASSLPLLLLHGAPRPAACPVAAPWLRLLLSRLRLRRHRRAG